MMIDQEQAVQLTIKKGVDCWNMQLRQQRGVLRRERRKVGWSELLPDWPPTARHSR